MSVTKIDFATFYKSYMQETHDCLDLVSYDEMQAVTESLWQAYKSGNRVWVAGNGGSAATAVHFACCLSEGTLIEGKRPFRSEALVANISVLTAIGNDFGYDHVFEYQLRNCLNRDDIFVAISCSGNSPNVVAACDYANKNGGKTIAFLGFSGGKLKEMAHQSVYINNYNYGQVETIHMSLGHLISQHLKDRVKSE